MVDTEVQNLQIDENLNKQHLLELYPIYCDDLFLFKSGIVVDKSLKRERLWFPQLLDLLNPKLFPALKLICLLEGKVYRPTPTLLSMLFIFGQ